MEIRFAGGQRQPSDTEKQIVQDFFEQTPISDNQRQAHEAALALFGFPAAVRHPLLTHIADPVFMERDEIQALRPKTEEMTSPDPIRQYLNRVLGDQWYRQGKVDLYERDFEPKRSLIEIVTNAIVLQSLFPDGQWKRYPDLLLREPIKTYARVLNLDAIFGARENWRLAPGLLNCTVEHLQQKAANLERHFGKAWRSTPALLIPSATTIDRMSFY